MSATQQTQTTDKEKTESLRRLQGFANQAGIDLNSASEQMFRVSPEYLDKSQRLELLRMILKVTPPPPSHQHYCVECGESINCTKEDCSHTEGECRSCHEGFRPGEWNAYERKLAQKGLL